MCWSEICDWCSNNTGTLAAIASSVAAIFSAITAWNAHRFQKNIHSENQKKTYRNAFADLYNASIKFDELIYARLNMEGRNQYAEKELNALCNEIKCTVMNLRRGLAEISIFENKSYSKMVDAFVDYEIKAYALSSSINAYGRKMELFFAGRAAIPSEFVDQIHSWPYNFDKTTRHIEIYTLAFESCLKMVNCDGFSKTGIALSENLIPFFEGLPEMQKNIKEYVKIRDIVTNDNYYTPIPN